MTHSGLTESGRVLGEDLLAEAAARVADGLSVDAGQSASESSDRLPTAEEKRALQNLRKIEAISNLRGASPSLASWGHDGASTRWGHLEVYEEIGSGSFGRVYRAYDPILRREVALKLAHETATPAQVRLIGEARRLARLRHPNVLAVYGADIHQGRMGLWTDLIDGATLEEVLTENPSWSEGGIVRYFRPVLDALVAVHRAELVHGDIKASNVVIDRDGTIVLVDFGAGRNSADPLEDGVAASPLSAAPELLAGAGPTAASDVYAAGALLFRMATGTYPLAAETLADLRKLHENRSGSGLSWPGPKPSRQFVQLVEAMLHPEPASRPTATVVVERLDWIGAAPSRRRRVYLVGTIIALLLGATLATSLGFVLARNSEAETRKALETNESVSDFVIGLFRESDPNQSQGSPVTASSMLELGAQRVERELVQQPEIQADLYLVLGELERKLGNLDRARDLMERALRLRRSQTSSDRGPVSEALLGMALVAFDQADYSRAEELQREALLLQEESGSGGRVVSKTLAALSKTVRAGGDYALAETLARDALRRFGPQTDSSPESADLLMSLAIPQYLQLRYEEARSLCLRALRINRQLYGEQHLSVASILNRLGLIAKREEQYEEAAAYFDQSRAIYQDLLGAEHAEVGMVTSNLGQVVRMGGDPAGGLELLERGADIQRQALGGNHPDVAITVNNIGLIHVADGNIASGVEYLREALSIWETTHGPLHPYVALAKSNLGGALLMLDRAEEALTLLQDALEVFCKQEPRGRFIPRTVTRLEQALRSVGRTREAAVLADSQDPCTPDDPR